MIHRYWFATFALAAVASPAFAQTSWYAGTFLGQSKTGSELVSNRESTVVNAAVTGSDFDSKDTGFKIFGGYRVLPWIALELNYTDLGQSRLQTNILNSNPPTTGSVTLIRKITGVGADALFIAPLGERASVYGRIGAVRSRLEADAALSGSIVFTSGNPADRSRTTTVNETVARYGVGGEWLVAPNVGLRIDWERWLDVGKKFEIGGSGNTGEADTDFYSLGVVYRF